MTEGIVVRNLPSGAHHVSRRGFLRRVSYGMAAAGLSSQVGMLSSFGQSALRDEEAYWRLVKDQFPIRPGFTLMNAANLCPSPLVVSDAVAHYTRDIDADASFQNRSKYGEIYDNAVAALARYMGAGDDEIVITRNTTEGNNQVVNGLDLGPEDEVTLWDQNHPSNNMSWEMRSRRYGFKIRRVTTPPAPADQDNLFDPFLDSLTSRTRVLSFSHVSNISGVALPAKRLCAMARERGILTLIDGAQTFGAHQVNLRDIGCDFYTGSAHKWLMGPKEGGLLYIRRASVAHLWPSVVGMGWNEDLGGSERFASLGQRDDAMYAAMGRTVDFLEIIGNAAIEKRVRALATALKRGIRDRIPGAQFLTPLEESLSGGVVIFSLPGVDHEAAYQALYHEHDIGGALIGAERLRLCPHIYNTMEEVERVVDVLAHLV